MMIAQILIAILITTIISTSFIKNNLNRDAQVKKTIAEQQLITTAAQKYQLDNGTWPDEANTCINAITVLSATPNAYLISVDDTSPFNTNYITSCSSTHFSIEVKTTQHYAGYIKHQGELPAVIKPAPDTDVTVTTIPKALADTVHDKFLALGDTPANNTKFQGNGNEIEDIAELTLSDGRTLSSAFNNEYSINVSTVPKKLIPKPNCGVLTPQVHISPGNKFSASNGKGIFGWKFVPISTPTHWDYNILVFTEDQAPVTAGANSLINARTRCL